MTDVIVIGNGVIGLSVALEFARRGATCRVLGARRPGAASGAAAGLLAPSIGRLSADVRPFFYASLARFPGYLDTLRDRDPELATIDGLIELSDVEEARHPPADAAPIRLDARQLAAMEPSLTATAAMLFHPRDGAIDNVRLLAALRAAALGCRLIVVHETEDATSVDIGDAGGQVATVNGSHVATTVVLAAGAWSAALDGLPRPLPVTPLKGQMLALRGTPLEHAVMGAGVYLVPRGSETVVGATTERSGFDVTTTGPAIAGLRAGAVAVCPALADAPLYRAWAGIRPATPDMLPILGPDPDRPRLVYACGHSKNGILLAPATATAIVACVTGEPTDLDIGPFRIGRFSRTAPQIDNH